MNLKNFFSPKNSFAIGLLIWITIILLLSILMISFIVTYPSQETIFDNIRFFILVMGLQFIAMIIMSRYFNSVAVQKELGNTIANYADINSLIHYYNLRNTWSYENLEKLKSLYLNSKKYEITVDASMQICNFYMFRPHRARYLEMERKSENEQPEND